MGKEEERFKDIIHLISTSPFAESDFSNVRSLLEALLRPLKEYYKSELWVILLYSRLRTKILFCSFLLKRSAPSRKKSIDALLLLPSPHGRATWSAQLFHFKS